VSGSAAPVRVTLANDFVVVVAGLAALLAPYADRVEVVDFTLVDGGGPGPGPQEAHAHADVVLFDTFGRRDLGREELGRLVADPHVDHVVVYASHTTPAQLESVLALGVSGVLTKHLDAARLVSALEAVARGERVIEVQAAGAHGPAAGDWPGRGWSLTQREAEVLALLARGRRNQEIAEDLFVSLDTVKSHIKVLYRKLGVRNRAEAVALAVADTSFSPDRARR
jgi:DNA-binding NarL/FixJ family response regulator